MLHYTDCGPAGIPRERHVCASCFRGYAGSYTTATELIDLPKQIFADGKCEKCGGPAQSISGVPGSLGRQVLCFACAEKEYGKNDDV